jgi:DNA-directed RNA polymerase subunit M
MRFCEKCGNLIISAKKGDKLKYVCRKCGYTPRERKVLATSIDEKIESKKDIVVFMSEDDELKEYPIDKKINCPKCGSMGAHWFIQQTRSADEAPTTFYCCVKCKHKWREY